MSCIVQDQHRLWNCCIYLSNWYSSHTDCVVTSPSRPVSYCSAAPPIYRATCRQSNWTVWHKFI